MLLLTITDWLEKNLFSCPIKRYTGIDCLGCGFQRSFILLLKGSFVESFKMYPATVPFLLLLIYTALHLRFDFKNGASIIKKLFLTTVTIMLGFYIYKFFNGRFFL